MLIPFGVLSAAASVPQGWTPAELTNLVAWYDASDASTITSSSNLVSQWNDKSTNGYNLAQGSGGNQPSTGLTTQNGKNLIQFADSKSLNANASSTAANWGAFSQSKTVIAIACIPETNNGILMSTNNSDNDTNGFRITLLDTNQNSMIVSSTTYVAINGGNNNITSRTAFAVFTYLTDPTNGTLLNRSEIYENNSAAFKNNTQSGSITTTVNNQLLLGVNNANGVSSKIGEIVMFSGADATEDNRLLVKEYLMNKWGL
jgi:hypothetical protein